MSTKSKHSLRKNEKTGKKGKKKKLEDSEDLESSEEELDLTKECHPIGYYINDRTEMINQMFSVIKGNKLKAMLPPILKDCDLDHLKLQCLDQLLGMSEKRIACVLDGEILESSSESDVESNEYESDDKNKSSSSSTSDGSEESVGGNPQNEREKSHIKGKKKGNPVEDVKSGKVSHNDSDPPAEQGKTLLEILELEMRAKAIRSLLKQNENSQEGNNTELNASGTKDGGVKGISDEVVDLTGCEDDDFTVLEKKEQSKEAIPNEKVTTVEEQVEKSQNEKGTTQIQEKDKAKRLQAELEFRNKLFKKKIYRTRQQRLENEDEESISAKQKANEQEEGELSSSEDETRTETQAPAVRSRPEPSGSLAEKHEELNVPLDAGSERVTSVRSGGFVPNRVPESEPNLESAAADKIETINNRGETEEDTSDSRECINLESEDEVLNNGRDKVAGSAGEGSESFHAIEETSWRDRWLQKDGVQKLVKSSKIYAKVKKRIAEKSQRSREEVNTSVEVKAQAKAAAQVEVIEGSIKEYEQLIGKTLQNAECSASKGETAKDITVDSENSRDADYVL